MKWKFYKRSLSLVGDVNLAQFPLIFLAYVFLYLCFGLLEITALRHGAC